MAVIGWIFAAIGIGLIIAAMGILIRSDLNVRFPKWIRVLYLIMASILNMSLSGLFFKALSLGPILTLMRIGSSLFDVCVLLIGAYLCLFKIEIKNSEFVYHVLFGSRVYSYDDITAASAEIDCGITSFVLTVGNRRIALNKRMQGYNNFYDKLEREKVFLRFPLI